ncbi:MAG: response regulator, partial [Chloroflexota bacterium]|nr:response regulator [Chloroflexota bacterium]
MQNAFVQDAKILIIDDQPANVRYLEMILEQAGAQHVQSTTDARQVAGLYRSGAPDLIVLDLMMP